MMNRYKMMQERALQAEQERKEIIKAKVKEMQADKMANPPVSVTIYLISCCKDWL